MFVCLHHDDDPLFACEKCHLFLSNLLSSSILKCTIFGREMGDRHRIFRPPQTLPNHSFALLGTDSGGLDTFWVDRELPAGAPSLSGDVSGLSSELAGQSLWTYLNKRNCQDSILQ